MKTFIFGDIHGCADTFAALLDRVQPDEACDRLILLGDLFDRGPQSWEVFQKVKELEGRFGSRFTLLRGNHEDYLLNPSLSWGERLVWERVGRSATVKSFKEHGEKMEDAAPWLSEHAELFCREEGFQCIHAGIKMDPPEINDTYTLIHDHDIVKTNRYAGPLTITGHIALSAAAWFPGAGGPVTVLPESVLCPLPEKGVICIDTGCGKGKGGRLTCMIVENGAYTLESCASV